MLKFSGAKDNFVLGHARRNIMIPISIRLNNSFPTFAVWHDIRTSLYTLLRVGAFESSS